MLNLKLLFLLRNRCARNSRITVTLMLPRIFKIRFDFLTEYHEPRSYFIIPWLPQNNHSRISRPSLKGEMCAPSKLFAISSRSYQKAFDVTFKWLTSCSRSSCTQGIRCSDSPAAMTFLVPRHHGDWQWYWHHWVFLVLPCQSSSNLDVTSFHFTVNRFTDIM